MTLRDFCAIIYKRGIGGGWVRLPPNPRVRDPLACPGGLLVLSSGTGHVDQGMGDDMADIDNGDVLRLGASWVYDSTEEIANVFHVLCTSGANKDFADIIDDIQQYLDLMFENIDTRLSTDMDVDRISIANVTQNLVFGSINWGVVAQGGDAGDPVASGVCCLAYGRTFKPRVQIKKYYGVFTESSMTAGLWSAAARDDVQTDFEAHIASQAMTDGLTMTGVAWNRILESYTLATGVVVASEPAYQRRRRRGRGS